MIKNSHHSSAKENRLMSHVGYQISEQERKLLFKDAHGPEAHGADAHAGDGHGGHDTHGGHAEAAHAASGHAEAHAEAPKEKKNDAHAEEAAKHVDDHAHETAHKVEETLSKSKGPEYVSLPTLHIDHIKDVVRTALFAAVPALTMTAAAGTAVLGKFTKDSNGNRRTLADGASVFLPGVAEKGIVNKITKPVKSLWKVGTYPFRLGAAVGLNALKFTRVDRLLNTPRAILLSIVGDGEKHPGFIRHTISSISKSAHNTIDIIPAIPAAVVKGIGAAAKHPVQSLIGIAFVADLLGGAAATQGIVNSIIQIVKLLTQSGV